MNARLILQRFFWVAFAIFLLASIPHVAYFFKSFEPEGAWYWAVAYAIAVTIDITTFLLSLTVAELRHRSVNAWLVSSVWVFIAALALLSWFINWQYATQFTSTMLARPERNGFVLWVNPVVASCFQVLSVAYTWISDKIAQSEVVNTQVKFEVNQIEPLIKSGSAMSNQVNLPVNEVNEMINQQNTGSLRVIHPVTTQVTEVTQEVTEVMNRREQIIHLLTTSDKSVTDIATTVGCSPAYVSKVKKQKGSENVA